MFILPDSRRQAGGRVSLSFVVSLSNHEWPLAHFDKLSAGFDKLRANG